MAISFRWIGLAALLSVGCGAPDAVRSIAGTESGLVQAAGTWAYTVSPAVRLAMELRRGIQGGQQQDAPPAGEAPCVEVSDELPSLSAADVVGAYSAGPSELVLDTRGGYVLHHPDRRPERGSFRIETGQVVLVSPTGDLRRFEPIDDGGLSGEGLGFAPIAYTPKAHNGGHR